MTQLKSENSRPKSMSRQRGT